ncbi:MAG: spermidine synthase, partial [Cyanobacteria bacterium J06641_5]
MAFTPAQRRLLLLTAATSSAAGLAAELLLGTLASYLVGSQALAYGVAVGGFLAAMGLGAYLSQFIATDSDRLRQQRQLLDALFAVELGVAPLTALLPLGLFALFVADSSLWLGLALATTLLGTLAGMEIPLITRLIEQDRDLRGTLAGVLALDYVGALVGSLALPLVLLPLVGLLPAAALIGSLPALMVFFLGRAFPRQRRWQYLGLAFCLGAIALAPFTLWASNRLED